MPHAAIISYCIFAIDYHMKGVLINGKCIMFNMSVCCMQRSNAYIHRFEDFRMSDI